MTNRGMAVLGVRLLALYFFIQHLSVIPRALRSDIQLDWSSSLTTLFPLLLSALLWFCAGPLASLILPRRTAAPLPAPINLSDWYGLAFAVVGLLIILYSLPDSLQVGIEIYWLWQESKELTSTSIATAAASMLQLALGFFVLLGNHGLSRVIVKLRTA